MKLPRSSLTEYAQTCQREGQRVVQEGDVWWREVRPFFFRPLLPFKPVSITLPERPWRAAIGGCQYVPPACGAAYTNSTLNYLAFLQPNNYTIDQLISKRRWQVKSAEKSFHVRPFSDVSEFQANAHVIYTEFYRRTQYGYLSQRVEKAAFDDWATVVFADPGLIPLGIWEKRRLVAASLSRIIDDTWIYSSFFATDEALRLNASSLMLHQVRSLAASVDGLTSVFVGMQKFDPEGQAVDRFYLQRGACVVSATAVLSINPVTRIILSLSKPSILRNLKGSEANHPGL